MIRTCSRCGEKGKHQLLMIRIRNIHGLKMKMCKKCSIEAMSCKTGNCKHPSCKNQITTNHV